MICLFCSCPFNQSNLNEMLNLLSDKEIGFVGISLVTDDYYSAVSVTKSIKDRLFLPVIWGGAHANVKADECLQHADMICLGEGEEALLQLVDSLYWIFIGGIGNTSTIMERIDYFYLDVNEFINRYGKKS